MKKENIFASTLKELRNAANVSQEELARQIHSSRSAIAKWENSKGLPSKASIEELAKFFNIDKDNLIDLVDRVKNSPRAILKRNKKSLIAISIVSVCSIIISVIGIVGPKIVSKMHKIYEDYEIPVVKINYHNPLTTCKFFYYEKNQLWGNEEVAYLNVPGAFNEIPQHYKDLLDLNDYIEKDSLYNIVSVGEAEIEKMSGFYYLFDKEYKPLMDPDLENITGYLSTMNNKKYWFRATGMAKKFSLFLNMANQFEIKEVENYSYCVLTLYVYYKDLTMKYEYTVNLK